MSYADLDSVLPKGPDGSTEMLKEYIEEGNLSIPKEANNLENVEKLPDHIMHHFKPPKEVEFNKEEKDEVDKLIARLKRWRMSYNYFESVRKPISPALQLRVDKAIASVTLEGAHMAPNKLEALILELQSAVGSDLDAPPAQADFILSKVNPVLEAAAINAGYDINGFSQFAGIHCKEPLVLALIEHDLLAGKKPSPLLMLAVSYLGVIQFTYYNNKLKSRGTPSNPSDHDPAGQSAGQSAPAGQSTGQSLEERCEALPPLF